MLPPFESLRVSTSMCRDLRSDHAGEAGAVEIYRGMIAASRSQAVLAFASLHIATEIEHLSLLDRWLPGRWKSRLLPLWRAMGWMLGYVAGAFGERFAYITVAAVERFVVAHYGAQIHRAPTPLRETLVKLQSDEQAHRGDALARVVSQRRAGAASRAWTCLVAACSSVAVMAARRI